MASPSSGAGSVCLLPAPPPTSPTSHSERDSERESEGESERKLIEGGGAEKPTEPTLGTPGCKLCSPEILTTQLAILKPLDPAA